MAEDFYDRGFSTVQVKKLISEGTIGPVLKSQNPFRRGLEAENFFFENFHGHERRLWNFDIPLLDNLVGLDKGTMYRFLSSRPDVNPPYDLTNNGWLGDVKLVYLEPDEIFRNIGDVFGVACTPAQRLNCRYFYIYLAKYTEEIINNRSIVSGVYKLFRCKNLDLHTGN